MSYFKICAMAVALSVSAPLAASAATVAFGQVEEVQDLLDQVSFISTPIDSNGQSTTGPVTVTHRWAGASTYTHRIRFSVDDTFDIIYNGETFAGPNSVMGFGWGSVDGGGNVTWLTTENTNPTFVNLPGVEVDIVEYGVQTIGSAFVTDTAGTLENIAAGTYEMVFYDSVETGPGDVSFQIVPNAPPPVVPLPAAGWLLLAGIGGILALKRRRT